MRTMVLSTAIGFLLASTAAAADCCAPCGKKDRCDRCGQQVTCKVVCDVKQVKRTVWVVECEEFCPTLPGRCGRCKSCCEESCGESCEAGCGCAKVDPCESLRCRKYVPPKCMKPRGRKKLVKKEVLCEVPVYKCVAVTCGCGGCEEAVETDQAETVSSPSPPADERSSELAPLPPVVGTSYLEALRLDE